MAFRPMRRAEREIGEAETWQIVTQSSYGVLSLCGDDGYPYGVPLNHVLMDGKLLFHAASEGHKMDALRGQPRACYTVAQGPLEEDPEALSPGSLGTYRSAVLFGTLSELPESEYEAALRALCARYTPDFARSKDAFTKGYDKLRILCFTVEHITGKKLLVH